MEQVKTTSKEEMRELAEVLAVFQKLPSLERIALTYYIKGRLDEKTENIELSIGLPKVNYAGSGAV